jgi:aldose 1-epimerase
VVAGRKVLAFRCRRLRYHIAAPCFALHSETCAALSGPIVTIEHFGKLPDGTAIALFGLKSDRIELQLIPFGAGIVSLGVPDRTGRFENVVLDFPDLAGYVRNHGSKSPNFFGSTIGRYANRIANARFILDGRKYRLAKNNGEHSLHGGPGGFYNLVWQCESMENSVAFRYASKDGEGGFPGNLQTSVRYSVTGPQLKIDYVATTDRTTVLNLTNHAYFNLAGAGNGSILSHRLKLFASRFTPTDAGLIPTGELRSVVGTAMDFQQSTAIGARIDAQDEQLHIGHGYDHNFILDGETAALKPAAELYEPSSGRVLEISTTEPAIQFYSGNFLDGTIHGKSGAAYEKYAGLCLETQHYPDSPNQPDFPTTVLRPGQTFRSTTILKFGIR